MSEIDTVDLSAVFSRLSPSSKRALAVANAFRVACGRSKVHMEHLLVGLYEKEDGPTMVIFENAGLFPGDLRRKLIDAELDAPTLKERPTARLRSAVVVEDALDFSNVQSVEAMPPLSAHAQQAIATASTLDGTDPPQGKIQSRHLLAGAFAVDVCDVIQLFAHLRPAVNALLDDGEAAAGGANTRGAPQQADRTEPVRDTAGSGAGAANDRASGEDHLHFSHYVHAFTQLIESPETRPPLVIGIFGSWGAGKSFLLNSVVNALAQRRPERRALASSARRAAYVYTVSFNAWEYNASATIWPRLVRRVLDTVNSEIRWHTRPLLWARKTGRSLRRNLFAKLRTEWPSLAAWLIVSAALAWVALGVLPSNFERMLTRLFGIDVGDAKFSFVAGVGALVAVGKLLTESVFVPLGSWARALLAGDANYGREDDAMRVIREDLDLLDRQLSSEHSRVLIVVDDLDRCEPEKAIEVLQAINLMLDRDNFIVALGIDARVVTAAVEKHYKDSLGPAGITGYEYLDKIVQIPFRIPDPTPDDVRDFLKEQLEAKGQQARADVNSRAARQSVGGVRHPSNPAGRGDGAVDSDSIPAGNADVANTAAASPSASTALVTDAPSSDTAPLTFSTAELRAFQSVADYLRPNPRHLKRLVNVYALVRALAASRNEPLIAGQPSLTVIWLALCAQWPYATREMLRHHDAVERARANGSYPAAPPLQHLLGLARPELDAVHQRRFDHDVDQLDRLVASASDLSWESLKTLRRFTLNFNPALDSELKLRARETSQGAIGFVGE